MSWPTTPLRRQFRILNGGTPTSDTENWDGPIPWATPVDLARVNGSILEHTDRTLTARGLATGSRSVPSGSLLVSIRAPIGYVAETKFAVGFNQGCRALVPTQPMSVAYFRYQLQSLTGRLAAEGQGSTFIELSADSLASVPLVVPPVSTQLDIATYLNRETARIDALIAAKRRMVRLLEDQRSAVLLNAIAPHLRKETPVASWQRIRLKYLFERPVAGVWGDEPAANAVDVTCVRVADFNRVSFRVSPTVTTIRSVDSATRRRCTLRDGDVLIEKSGGGEGQPVGFAVMVDRPMEAICSNFIARLRPMPDFEASYAGLVMAAAYRAGCNSPFVKQTTGIQNLDLSAYLASTWYVPDRHRQREICGHVTSRFNAIDRLTSVLSAQMALLQEHRQAVITDAVTGQLDISRSDAAVPV
ncbi:MAG: restriction endonuclease subunit S [Solirubrobacteraceae bacterium]